MSEEESASDKALAEHLCTNCNVALMEDHPTLRDWLKCELCGFCNKRALK